MSRAYLILSLLCPVVVPLVTSSRAGDAANVSFNRDIRPILADNCFQCHGPDKNQRKAKLRLDTGEGALADRGDYRVVTPGKPEASELLRRVSAEAAAERMPPAKTGKRLSEKQIELIRRWIEQGAKWERHWAFLPPSRPELPRVANPRWPRNGIDHFILERLEREALSPAAEADKITLLRRVTLDLTGLPPTPAEVDAFVADTSADAYEKVVDRLLASPRYGERMARPWLDAARYADTNGYQTDGERTMWRWRDWVIDAFNHNKPFDQFTIEQLAGDLLEDSVVRSPLSVAQEKEPQRATNDEQRTDRLIATGFNRNHRGNGEGGVIPEEYAVEYVVDRVETTATVWLGLTLGCARCHDHKYDPIAQKEFYQVFAYFNNVPEKGKAVKHGNSPPFIKTPTRAQRKQLAELETLAARAADRFRELGPGIDAAQAEWERSLPGDRRIHWDMGDTADGIVARFRLDREPALGPAPWSWREGDGAFAPGRIGEAGDFDGRRFLDAGDLAKFGFFDKFSLSAWIFPRGDKGGTILSRMLDQPQAEGYAVVFRDGRIEVDLVKRWLDDALRVETEERFPADQWRHVTVTYDGSRVAEALKVYVDGRPARLRVLLDDLNQSFETKEPLRIGAGNGPEGRFHGLIDDVRLFERVLEPEEAEVLACADAITDLASSLPKQRTRAQARKLRRYYIEQQAPAPLRTAWRQSVTARRNVAEFIERIPTTMIMEELPKPRDAFVLLRGAYDKPGEKVEPGLPSALLAEAGSPRGPSGRSNRLDFARWLVHDSNPLTARVAVNRFWQMYFGAGLVRTVEDFGVQGEWPSHPELLDWLATEFIRTGWDVKAMQRLIVTSATYRQSSRVTPALLQKDPQNRLLARGARLRLPAETIRDQALAISELLVEKVGGPSVKPYQPPGLWKELSDAEDYRQDHGENLYRRSLYTFWKRAAPPPVMISFDAAGRETCIVRESRTSTPLQALNLMNDLTFVEAARVLAQRIMTDGGATPEERLTLAFRLAAARRPNAAELKVLVEGFRRHLAEYRENQPAALKLTSVGEHPRNDKLDVSELAAYTAVAQLILNLDEVITKE